MTKLTVDTTYSDANAKKSNPGLTGYEKPNAAKYSVFDSRPTKVNADGTVDLNPSRFDRK